MPLSSKPILPAVTSADIPPTIIGPYKDLEYSYLSKRNKYLKHDLNSEAKRINLLAEYLFIITTHFCTCTKKLKEIISHNPTSSQSQQCLLNLRSHYQYWSEYIKATISNLLTPEQIQNYQSHTGTMTTERLIQYAENLAKLNNIVAGIENNIDEYLSSENKKSAFKKSCSDMSQLSNQLKDTFQSMVQISHFLPLNAMIEAHDEHITDTSTYPNDELTFYQPERKTSNETFIEEEIIKGRLDNFIRQLVEIKLSTQPKLIHRKIFELESAITKICKEHNLNEFKEGRMQYWNKFVAMTNTNQNALTPNNSPRGSSDDSSAKQTNHRQQK